MNTPYNFHFNSDPLLQGNQVDIDAQIKYLQQVKAQSQIQQAPTNKTSLWIEIDKEFNSLTDEQKSMMLEVESYTNVTNKLSSVIQEFIINSVKADVENSEIGNRLLQDQLSIIKSNKEIIIKKSNEEVEIFKKFQHAAKINPNLTYLEFCETLKN